MNTTLQDTMVRLCREFSPKSYLEVGCYDGRSLRWVVENTPSLERITVCDTWRGKECLEAGFLDHSHVEQMLDGLLFKGERIWMDGSSQQLLPFLARKRRGQTFDLILVDGNHDELPAFVDLLLCWRLLNLGGWLVMDDTHHQDHPWLLSVAHRFDLSVEQELHGEALPDWVKDGLPKMYHTIEQLSALKSAGDGLAEAFLDARCACAFEPEGTDCEFCEARKEALANWRLVRGEK